MATFGLIVFILALILGLIAIIIGLPGDFIIFGVALGYGIFTGFEKISLTILIILFLLAALSEVIDNVLGLLGAKKYGSSKWGIIGAIIGGLLGGILGVSLISIPFIGSLIGIFIGLFLGTFVAEFIFKKEARPALQAAYGAFLGRVGAILVKLLLGAIMIAIILIKIF